MEKQKLHEQRPIPELPAPAGDITVNWGTPQQRSVDGYSATQMDAHAREAWTMGLDAGMEHAPAAVETTLPDLARLLGTASKEGKAVNLSAIAAGTLYNAMTSAAAAQPVPSATPLHVPGHAGHIFTGNDLASMKSQAQQRAADGANWSMDVGCMFVLAMIERIEASAAPAPAPAPTNHAAEMDLARRIGMLLANKTTISPVTAGKPAVDIIKMLPRADQQLAGYISPEDLPKLGQCRATLWAAPQADAVPVFLGAPAAAAGNARIAELEGAIDKLAECKGRFHTEASFKALIEVRGKKVAS